MDSAYRSGSALGPRELATLLLVGVAIANVHLGCGNVVVDAGGAGAGGNGSGTAGTGADGGGCALTTTGSAGGITQLTACIDMPPGGCPNEYNAAQFITPASCAYLVSVDCGPVTDSAGRCCYVVEEQVHACMP